jgi:hypothetical protein
LTSCYPCGGGSPGLEDKSQPEGDEDGKDAGYDKDYDEQPDTDHCGGYVCESFHGGLLKYIAGQVSLV